MTPNPDHGNRLDRINRVLEGVKRGKRTLETPEGITFDVEIANHGERLTAFVIDFFFWIMATVLLFLALALLLFEHVGGPVAMTIIFFIAFLVRNLYFIHFELAALGSTPGKRIVGLKVVDRQGGPLLPAAIVARNLTREVEVFLPLGLFFSLGAGRGAGFWMQASYLGWIALISALPFFNRDHLRAGDLVAGTMVIALPRRILLDDLVEAKARYAFSRRQLDVYGAFELQVLEELLRRPPSPDTSRLLQEVSGKIARKIDWLGDVPAAEALPFLTAFYTAQRAHLEREQLFGKFRADKASVPTGGEQG
jgi:uncharacterized RDD family membrane protein YckC